MNESPWSREKFAEQIRNLKRLIIVILAIIKRPNDNSEDSQIDQPIEPNRFDINLNIDPDRVFQSANKVVTIRVLEGALQKLRLEILLLADDPEKISEKTEIKDKIELLEKRLSFLKKLLSWEKNPELELKADEITDTQLLDWYIAYFDQVQIQKPITDPGLVKILKIKVEFERRRNKLMGYPQGGGFIIEGYLYQDPENY